MLKEGTAAPFSPSLATRLGSIVNTSVFEKNTGIIGERVKLSILEQLHNHWHR